MDKEVRKSTPTQKGDYKPLVFTMTDGQPTDNWIAVADSLKSKKLGSIICCAAGAGATVDPLKQVTEIVVKLHNLQPDTLKQFFKWVSDSIKLTSASVAQVTADGVADPHLARLWGDLVVNGIPELNAPPSADGVSNAPVASEAGSESEVIERDPRTNGTLYSSAKIAERLGTTAEELVERPADLWAGRRPIAGSACGSGSTPATSADR